ncbi:MAG: DUF4136 domain-containing protein [Chitinophagaceae bacterium]|nr:DUF4136 domain-containing protein [Chitinophagaceae bacterium]
MKKGLLLLPALAFLLILSSCSPSLKVTTDYDKNVSFSNYKTYSFYQNEKGGSAISELNQERILNAIRTEMGKKGFQENSSSPDLLVNQVTILKDKVAVSSTTDYYGYGGVYRPYFWGAGGGVSANTQYNVDHYKDGSLMIDIIDANTKHLVWQGIGDKEIDKPLKDPDTEIATAIETIMAGFPPGIAKK